jgi:hypothetical protein
VEQNQLHARAACSYLPDCWQGDDAGQTARPASLPLHLQALPRRAWKRIRPHSVTSLSHAGCKRICKRILGASTRAVHVFKKS